MSDHDLNAPCFHCGTETDIRCSDCAIANEVTHEGLPVCPTTKCRDDHDEWHKQQPMSIADLEELLDRDVDIAILPNGRVVAGSGKPLTFRQNLGGEYAYG